MKKKREDLKVKLGTQIKKGKAFRNIRGGFGLK